MTDKGYKPPAEREGELEADARGNRAERLLTTLDRAVAEQQAADAQLTIPQWSGLPARQQDLLARAVRDSYRTHDTRQIWGSHVTEQIADALDLLRLGLVRIESLPRVELRGPARVKIWPTEAGLTEATRAVR